MVANNPWAFAHGYSMPPCHGYSHRRNVTKLDFEGNSYRIGRIDLYNCSSLFTLPTLRSTLPAGGLLHRRISQREGY